MEKKRCIITVILIISTLCLCGCSYINGRTTERTFRNVYISSINKMDGSYKTQPYTIIFSDGTTINKVIDRNIFKIDKEKELEYITFITSLQYKDAYDIKDFKYLGE